MRALRNLLWFAVGFMAITAYAVSLEAHAQSSSGDSYTWYRNPDGSWSRTPNPAGGTPGKNFRFPPGAQWQAEAGGPRVVSNRKLPVPHVTVAEIIEDVKIPKAALKTAGRLALRTMPYALIAAEVINAVTDDDIWHDAESGTWMTNENDPPDSYPFPSDANSATWRYLNGSPSSWSGAGISCLKVAEVSGLSALKSAVDACAGQTASNSVFPTRQYKVAFTGVWSNPSTGTPPWGVSRSVYLDCISPSGCSDEGANSLSYRGEAYCTSGYTMGTVNGQTYCLAPCPDGSSPVNGQCLSPRPATDQEIEDAFENEDIMTDAEIAQWFSEQQRLYLPDDTPMTLTPSQTSISTPIVVSTSTTPNGTTRTETSSRVDLTGGGSTVNTSYVTTSITNITTVYNENNEVVRHDETPQPVPPPTPEPDIEPEPDTDEDFDFVDSSFPDVPELYQQKYPEGIKGVWNAKKPELMQTPFIAGIASMFPSFGSGACPVWSMDFNILPGSNYGTQVFSVPCWIFQAIGLIILTSAVFAARWIIFGG